MKTNTLLIWTLAILLAFVLMGSGLSKIGGTEMQIDNFESWGFPLWTRIPIGLAEMAIGAGLLIPKYRTVFVVLVFVWGLAAVSTHIQAVPAQYLAAAMPLVIMVVNILLLSAILKKPEPEKPE